jgi:hypothetical protein
MKPTDEEIERGRQRGREEAQYAAIGVRFDPEADAIALEMRSGATVTLPRKLIPYLRDLPKVAAENATLSPAGNSLWFDAYDLHYSIRGLLPEVFGLPWKSPEGDQR